MGDAEVIFWFRRDLRIADHPALLRAAALGAAGRLCCCFVVDDQFLAGAGPARRQYLTQALEALDADLGGALHLAAGPPEVALVSLAEQVGASMVVATGEPSPVGRRRDARVGAALAAIGVDLELVDSPYLVAPGRVRSAQGTPYQVFTPYFRALGQLPVVPPQPRATLPELLVVPSSSSWSDLRREPPMEPLFARVGADGPSRLPAAGEAAAWARLTAFAEHRVDGYDEARNRLDLDATSRLSADLHFGCLHPRQVLAEVTGGGAGRAAFRRQLAWREFYADVAFHQPQALWEDLRPNGVAVDVGPAAEERFIAWVRGETGFPVVDAAMRQLLTEGFMHNRARLVAASFFIKDLHLDWRLGARWFLHRLVDGDVASNNHGWQWVAGVGTDAAPYDRIFNPTLQQQRFDPTGAYVQAQVAELGEDGTDPGGLFARGYPSPMVDHQVERLEALARLAAAKAAR